MKTTTEEWRKHPKFLADGGGLFGAPPNLVCQYCDKTCYVLFYGHCKECAKNKNIPRESTSPQEFHDTFNKGTTTVITGAPKEWNNKWWRLKHWFSKWLNWKRWFSKK